MSKATSRTWRKKHNRIIREREQTRKARLRGFKPATVGEMLAEVSKRPKR